MSDVIEAEVVKTDMCYGGGVRPGGFVTVDMFPEIPSGLTADVPQTLSVPKGAMKKGEVRFGVTCTGEPVGSNHWLVDSSVYGDMVMTLPSAVLVAGRTKEAGGVAVDMLAFLDAVVEGAAKLEGLEGVAAVSSLPVWAVLRLFGTFDILMAVYHDALDQAVLVVEAAAMKAAIGMKVTNTRRMTKTKVGAPGIAIAANGKVVATPGEETKEESVETIDKHILPDAALSKLILTSRMRGRYKDEGGVKQAVQINICGAAAKL